MAKNKQSETFLPIDKVSEMADQMNAEAAEQTHDKGDVEKSHNEKIVEKETQIDITTGANPLSGQTDFSAMGAAMGSEMAKAFLQAGISPGQNQQQLVGRITYGATTGKTKVIEAGDLVGYFPVKGGRGSSQGGWFLISEQERDESISSDMSIVAVAQERTHYDEGHGVLYHELKFTVTDRWSFDRGRIVRRGLEDARKHAFAQAKERSQKKPSQLVGV